MQNESRSIREVSEKTKDRQTLTFIGFDLPVLLLAAV